MNQKECTHRIWYSMETNREGRTPERTQSRAREWGMNQKE